MELALVLERELTTMRPQGGLLTDVHVCQLENGSWHINVRLSWRGSSLFHVGLFDTKRMRTYKRLSSAIRHIVTTYQHDALISVHPFIGRRIGTDF